MIRILLTAACLIQLASAQLPLAKLESAVESGEFKKISSVVVLRHGKPVYEHYFEGDASTLRDTRSATKTITSALVGIAIRERKLSLDSRIFALLPSRAARVQNPDPRKARIAVEDFLTMSSCLECDDWNDASRGNEERMYIVEDWAQFILDLPVRGRMRLGEKRVPPPHGRDFSYCTGGVFVLSEALAAATRARTDRYAKDKLFAPLAIGEAEWVFSPLDVPQTGGGLRLSTLSLARIAQLYLNGGEWNGVRILDRSWVEASTTPHARIDDQREYGYLWWLVPWRSGGKTFASYCMMGNGGNKVRAIPSLDAVAAITSTNYNTRGMHEQTDRILTEFIIPALAR